MSNCKIKVPSGGGVITRFELTPQEKGSWIMNELINDSGKWNKGVGGVEVLFPKDLDCPESESKESVMLVVAMSEAAIKAGWTFIDEIYIYNKNPNSNVNIKASITTDCLIRVFEVTENGVGNETIDYGFVASFKGEKYRQPDPSIIVSRPT